MGKRSVDPAKWRDPFYRALPLPYKLLWDFIHCDCDNSGVWIVDMKIASIAVTRKVREFEALEHFAGRVVSFDEGRKWFITGFIAEQVAPELSAENKYHKSVLDLLQKHKITIDGPQEVKGLTRPLEAPIYIAKGRGEAEVQGGVGGKEALAQEEIFTRSFDERTMEGYTMAFKELDVARQLEDFKLKVRNAWSEYRHRDLAGMRNAFHHHLRRARETKSGPIPAGRMKAFKL